MRSGPGGVRYDERQGRHADLITTNRCNATRGPARMTESPFSLDGRVALVTGASRGIGWALANALSDAGADVLLASRNEADLRARAEILIAKGRPAEVIAFDTSREATIAEGLERAYAVRDRIDILVNNAGAGMRKAFGETTDADFSHITDTNLRGPFHLARLVASGMKQAGGGVIVNVASALAVLGREKAVLYTASKHALAGMTKALACELAPHGIRVNAICPGYVETEMMTSQRGDETFYSAVNARTPLGRWARPDEMGGAAVFLASDAASYVTGHLLAVDGGLTVSV